MEKSELEDMFVVAFRNSRVGDGSCDGSTGGYLGHFPGGLRTSMSFCGINCSRLSVPCHIAIGDCGKGASKND